MVKTHAYKSQPMLFLIQIIENRYRSLLDKLNLPDKLTIYSL